VSPKALIGTSEGVEPGYGILDQHQQAKAERPDPWRNNNGAFHCGAGEVGLSERARARAMRWPRPAIVESFQVSGEMDVVP
jgi:hypothetical protein